MHACGYWWLVYLVLSAFHTACVVGYAAAGRSVVWLALHLFAALIWGDQRRSGCPVSDLMVDENPRDTRRCICGHGPIEHWFDGTRCTEKGCTCDDYEVKDRSR